MNSSPRNQIIALAGVFQAAALVERLAKTGTAPEEECTTCVQSLFKQNPDSVEDVFGGAENIEFGLKILRQFLAKRQHPEFTDSLRYVLSILYLQRQLGKNQAVMEIVGSRLDKAKSQLEHFGPNHDNLFAALAGIYTDTLSTFRFRIQVLGDFNYLQQQRIANQIRTLLFAGVRAAMLWRQTGGSRMHLVFKRKKLVAAADRLLEEFHTL